MGHIDRFNIQTYIEDFDTSIFIETGTGIGHSLQHAVQFPFEKIYTIEIVESLYEQCKEQFKEHTNCEFINNNSKDGLVDILKGTKEGNICFWLDAHFPGADFGLVPYGTTKDASMRIPLESELRAIVEVRDTKNDVLLIDDLRIYEDGPFQGGNWNERSTLGADGIDFIYELFDKTHDISKDFRDQGYIVITPKK